MVQLALTTLLAITLWLQPALRAQTANSGELPLNTGKEIYHAACVGCHGPEGKGMPLTTVGFETAFFPDFSECSQSSREPNTDWKAIIHQGGPVRGFSEIMPSFTEALNPGQIEKVIEYIRRFCTDRSWPRGELNLPRPLITEKAFPEDETVITTTINAEGAPGVSSRIVYERRFGAGNQIELAVPFQFEHRNSGSWLGGVGDIDVGFKRLLFHNLKSGSIVSLFGEVVLPTGNRARGLGSGVTIFEVFATYGQILPAKSFFQFQGGVELPTDRADAPKAVFWRSVLGKTFSQDKGFGRNWSPMVEVLADRDLIGGRKTNWDVVPQLMATLNKRQHLQASIGVRFPVNNTGSRSTQVLFFLLWDWFDGGLRDGWK